MSRASVGDVRSFGVGELRMDPDHVVIVDHYVGTSMEADGAEILMTAIAEFCGHEPGYGIILVNGVRANIEARTVMARRAAVFRAAGIVLRNRFEEVMGNFFLRVSRPKTNMRAFSDLESARIWLHEQMRQDGLFPPREVGHSK